MQVEKVRRRRSRAEVEQLVAEYEASGLGRTTFCRQRGLSLSTLARYRRRQQSVDQTDSAKRWLAVEVSGSSVAGSEGGSGLALLAAGGWRIEVGRGFDAGTLKRLLGVVEPR